MLGGGKGAGGRWEGAVLPSFCPSLATYLHQVCTSGDMSVSLTFADTLAIQCREGVSRRVAWVVAWAALPLGLRTWWTILPALEALCRRGVVCCQGICASTYHKSIACLLKHAQGGAYCHATCMITGPGSPCSSWPCCSQHSPACLASRWVLGGLV